MLTGFDYRLLTLADVEAAATIMAEAFMDDPLCAFMLPLRWTRRSTLRTFFRAYGELNLKNQRGYGAGEPLQGVAFWQAPGRDSLSLSLTSLGAWLPLLFSLYPLGYWRARAVLKRIDQLHIKHAGQPHFYLDNLGVRPAARGQGWASKLIRPFLERADAQHSVAYTDTVTRANVALYEHFGFECVEASTISGTGLTVWALRRPAASIARSTSP